MSLFTFARRRRKVEGVIEQENKQRQLGIEKEKTPGDTSLGSFSENPGDICFHSGFKLF